MELFSPEWLASLTAIVLIDLLLAGDNAVVIALAARNLPDHLRKRAVFAGTAGAIVVRVALVFFALELLKLPGLSLAGGAVLYWVAWRLLSKNDEPDPEANPKIATFWAAMRTIIIADTIMGLDNILAIAGASRGDWGLVIFGFLLSIPIMIGGSFLILKLMKKAPWLITAGCGLLGIIAGRMMLDDWWFRAQLSWAEKGQASAQAAGVEWAIIIAVAFVFTAIAQVICSRRLKETKAG